MSFFEQDPVKQLQNEKAKLEKDNAKLKKDFDKMKKEQKLGKIILVKNKQN